MVRLYELYHIWHFPIPGPVNSGARRELAGQPKPTAPR